MVSKLPENSFKPIDLQEFKNHLKSTNKRSAPGEDGITNKMIENCPINIKSSIINLFNYSITNSIIPKAWKTAKIIMIHKPGKKESNIASYRPISLLSNIGKLLEKIINSRLVNYLEENNLISIHQSGFRKNRSTKDHIIRLTQDVRANFNQNNYTGAVFFDVSKAFDRTWHDGIIYKLNSLKVPQYILFWINNFLQVRSFYVSHITKNSSAYVILAGVPQGSTISQTLFKKHIQN